MVRAITDGEFIVRGPMYTGVRPSWTHRGPGHGEGPDRVTERNCEPLTWELPAAWGSSPRPRSTSCSSRACTIGRFCSDRRHIIECDGVGVTSSNYSQFRFTKVRRPIYPLDLDATP